MAKGLRPPIEKPKYVIPIVIAGLLGAAFMVFRPGIKKAKASAEPATGRNDVVPGASSIPAGSNDNRSLPESSVTETSTGLQLVNGQLFAVVRNGENKDGVFSIDSDGILTTIPELVTLGKQGKLTKAFLVGLDSFSRSTVLDGVLNFNESPALINNMGNITDSLSAAGTAVETRIIQSVPENFAPESITALAQNLILSGRILPIFVFGRDFVLQSQARRAGPAPIASSVPRGDDIAAVVAQMIDARQLVSEKQFLIKNDEGQILLNQNRQDVLNANIIKTPQDIAELNSLSQANKILSSRIEDSKQKINLAQLAITQFEDSKEKLEQKSTQTIAPDGLVAISYMVNQIILDQILDKVDITDAAILVQSGLQDDAAINALALDLTDRKISFDANFVDQMPFAIQT